MKDNIIRKTCVSCKGSGTMYFDSFYAEYESIRHRGYEYIGAFINQIELKNKKE